MLKRGDSIYSPGRIKGPWWKWKRDPLSVDAVLMYAQRGHGKRSSFYSDYTFGVWREEGGERELDPGRQGLFRLYRRGAALARQVRARNHTTNRFGPVRECVERDFGWCWRSPSTGCSSPRGHKSGVALRFPAHQPHPLGQAAREAGATSTMAWPTDGAMIGTARKTMNDSDITRAIWRPL
jgi:DNA ligase-1